MILSRSLESPLFYLSKKELFKIHRRKAEPIYLKSCEFFGATLIDRTETLNSGFNYKIIDKIPFSEYRLSFEDACLKRAEEILKQDTGKINVLWSGGIDSTLALVSLLRVQARQNGFSRLHIILSQNSVNEYFSFYKDVIENNLSHTIIKDTIYESISANDTIVTGEHGDQLFGSDKLKYTVISKDAFSPYPEILDFVIGRKLGTDKYTADIIAYLAPVISKCPFRIHTLYDYLWWVNFALKWQTVSMRILAGIERSASDLDSNVFHFFRTEDFQLWSIHNHDKKIKSDWHTYKFVAKELIYKFHKDEEYLLNKEKEPSLKEVIRPKDKPMWFFNLFGRKAEQGIKPTTEFESKAESR